MSSFMCFLGRKSLSYHPRGHAETATFGVALLHHALFTNNLDIKFAPMHHIVFNIDIIHTASRPAG